MMQLESQKHLLYCESVTPQHSNNSRRNNPIAQNVLHI